MMSSMQIAELNGGFQQMGMQQLQSAAMVGQQSGMNSPGFAERTMGKVANLGSSIGGPLAMGGMALAGMDPLSMGFRGAVAGYGSGGALGAVGMGLGAAGVAGAGLMAGQYAVSQFMTGMQQRQQLNDQMRQSFTFFNPQSPSGQGFTTSQLGSIGKDMRSMVGQTGTGQMVGFEELGRLASNMGRMGMSQGVKDAKDFSDKFKEMVRSLKEIATQMGTSMEEAQKLTGAMRQSGVFGAKSAASFAGMIRTGAQAGGLATTELTGMMNVGSQISRMIGGRGRAGAQGGLDTITNIGVARQMGIMGEEDIYNVTGLTGAEGRQAMATQMMQTSAQFLRSGLGRRAVAAMAGKNGTLNEDAVGEFMEGGVGTGRTMQLAYQNLGKTGRADFIRNEGRIRGEVLGRMGGLAPAMIMGGWLQQRGIDVNEDSDRAMIFMQRRLGMGRDEADMMVRMARELPRMMERRRESAAEGVQFAKSREAQQGRGIEGLKRRLEKARSDVQNSLQKAGDDFMQEGTEMIEKFVNRLTDTYEQRYFKDIQKTFRAGEGMGESAAQARRGISGSLEGVNAATNARFDAESKNIFGGGARGGGLSEFRKGTFGQQSGLLGGAYSVLAGGQSLEGKYASMGWNSLLTAKNDDDLQRGLRGVQLTGMAYQRGLSSLDGKDSALGAQYSSELRGMFARGQIKGLGQDRMRSFGSALEEMAAANPNDASLRAAADRYARAPATAKAQMMGEMVAGGRIPGQEDALSGPEGAGLFERGRFRTQGERFEAIGSAFYAESSGAMGAGQRKTDRNWARAAMAGFVALSGGAGMLLVSKEIREGITKGFSKGGDTRALAQFMERDEFQRMGQRALGGGEAEAKAARADMESRLSTLQLRRERAKGTGDKSLFTATDQAEMDATEALTMAQDVSALDKKYAKDGVIPEDEKERLGKKYGKSWEDVLKRATVAGASLKDTEKERRAETIRQMRDEGISGLNAMRGPGGMLENTSSGKLALKAGLASKFKEGSAASKFLRAATERQKGLATLTGAESRQREDGDILDRAQQHGASMTESLSEMTVAQKRDLIGSLRGVSGGGELRQRIQSSLGIQQRLMKLGKGSKGVRGMAEMMGIDISQSDIEAALKGGGDAGAAADILSAGGISLGGAAQKDLQAAIAAQRKGDTGKSSEMLRSLMAANPEVRDAMDKKKLEADKERNPTMAKVEGHLSDIKGNMGKMPGLLQQIANNTGTGEADGEAKK